MRRTKAQIEADKARDNARKLLEGNSEFKLTKDQEAKALAEFEAKYAEPTKGQVEAIKQEFAAYTDEDAALDRELEKQHENTNFSDDAPVVEVKKTKDTVESLRDIVEDYKPATTLAELNEQVHVAKAEGVQAIEATPSLVRHVFRKDYPHIENVTGYGIYHDVRVYIDGFFAKLKNQDKETIDQRLERLSKK